MASKRSGEQDHDVDDLRAALASVFTELVLGVDGRILGGGASSSRATTLRLRARTTQHGTLLWKYMTQ